MSDGLCDMALAGSAGSGDEDRGLFAEEAAGHEVVDQGGIDSGVEVEVELLDRLAGRKAGPSVPQVEPALVAAGHFVADEWRFLVSSPRDKRNRLPCFILDIGFEEGGLFVDSDTLEQVSKSLRPCDRSGLRSSHQFLRINLLCKLEENSRHLIKPTCTVAITCEIDGRRLRC